MKFPINTSSMTSNQHVVRMILQKPNLMLKALLLKALLLIGAVHLGFGVVAQESSSYTGYLLGTGDQIEISVYEEEDLSFDQIRIGESGTITYPFLGDLRVSGITINQLQADIENGLIDGEYLVQPEVTVTILEYRPFYVDGEVNNPGGYPFEPGLTLRKAVTIAGGFTERASRSKISVISGADRLSSDSAATTTSREVELDSPIRPGDIITVAQRFF